MRAFITGGSGFVGRNLIAALVKRGDHVVALARSDASARACEAAGRQAEASEAAEASQTAQAAEGAGAAVTIARGDLDATDVLREHMAGCDAVFHVAAKVEDWGERSEFFRINVDGTRHVLDAARAAGVGRLVHVSTEAVLVGRPIVNADETMAKPEHPIGLYPLTKGKAEDLVVAASDDALGTVVVRPRFVWGAGDTTLLPVLAQTVASGKFRWIGGGDHKTSTCHVANLVHGALLAADVGTPGAIYFLTDGEPVVMREFLTAMLEAGGVTPGDKTVPLWLAKAMAWTLEGVWRLLSLGGQPPITRTAVKLVGEEVTVDDAKARRELGYAPVMSRADGLAGLRASVAG